MATELPKPAPISADVGFNISGIPGPPFGPSLRITTTCPALISPLDKNSITSSSRSQTFASPSKRSPSFPVILAIAPSVAKLPYNT